MTMNDSEVDTELSRDDYASGGRGDEKEESAAAAAAKHDNHNREMERADYNDNYNPNDRNESATAGGAGAGAGGGAGGASSSGIKLRPVFLGNLDITYKSEDVADIFSRPMVPQGVDEGTYRPFAVDQIDVKKGYCFVYLKNVSSEGEKASVENFVRDICGMSVPGVSSALRAEMAKGDGRVKRKEEDRRRDMRPSETLFVVNFAASTTQGDLEMLFGPFGHLQRIDMKGNYAFVQFSSIDEAIKAKESTNGGKLDRNVLTVEYVANQRGGSYRGGGGGGGRRGGFRGGGGGGGGRGDRRSYDDRGPPPPPSRRRYMDDRQYDDRIRGGRDDRRYNDRGRDYDDYRRSRSPSGGGFRRRSRSRSRSPPRRYDDDRRERSLPRYHDRRERSPPRYRSDSPPPPRAVATAPAGAGGRGSSSGRYDDYRMDERRIRGQSPPGGYRDRGYRP